MSCVIRPDSNRLNEIELAINVLACALPKHGATYVAVPITGGKRFLAWFQTTGRSIGVGTSAYSLALHNAVVEPNSDCARERIDAISTRLREKLVNPSEVTVSGWTQDDYRHFWGRVVEKYVRRTIFLDGWNYSSGCVYEFYICSILGVPTLNEELRVISRREGMQLIDNGLDEISVAGIPHDFIDQIREALAGIDR